MADAELVDRLAALPKLAGIPREELEWLVAHGELEKHEPGVVIGPKGKPIEKLFVLLSGHIGIRVDRGAGPRRVMEWRTGDVTGMLPYSRMKGPPGDNTIEAKAEALSVHVRHHPEMIRECPTFTAHCVHIMLDRARNFNTSDLQDEKMVSLGKLAAGLAHELNNPASATVRGAKVLLRSLADAEAAARALGAAGLDEEQYRALEMLRVACLATPTDRVLSPIQRADREEEFVDWLERQGLEADLAADLADTAVTLDVLDTLATGMSGEMLAVALRWIAAGCSTHALVKDIEHAATRIHELVAAVKRFTYMDNLAGPEFVDVEAGLRDTIRVISSKAKAKNAAITLDIEPDLPRAHATGGELNQVWLNLIDNALDAIEENGTVSVTARRELDFVVVSVTDDGPGINPDIMPRIFDPFFTTKPPGQGTGLGLDITRRLLRRYDGDISAESGPDGTRFRVRLPTEKA